MEYPIVAQFIINFFEKYGFWGLFGTLIILSAYKFGDRFLIKLSESILNRSEYKTKQLKRKRRKESIFAVNEILKDIMNNFDTDRISIFEYHNGGSNLSSLPFFHFSITMQINKIGVDDLNKDFDNLHISSVPDFIYNLDKQEYYYATVDELKNIFPKLYKDLYVNDIKEVLFANIEGSNDPIGFIMICFKQPNKINKKQLEKTLSKKIQKLAINLDGKI